MAKTALIIKENTGFFFKHAVQHIRTSLENFVYKGFQSLN